MWRAFFLATGVTLLILGVEGMVLDRVVLASKERRREEREELFRGSSSSAYAYDQNGLMTLTGAAPDSGKTVKMPEWAPWSLLSTGAIILLYALRSWPGGD